MVEVEENGKLMIHQIKESVRNFILSFLLSDEAEGGKHKQHAEEWKRRKRGRQITIMMMNARIKWS